MVAHRTCVVVTTEERPLCLSPVVGIQWVPAESMWLPGTVSVSLTFGVKHRTLGRGVA